jgi:hypothetical protein
VILLLFHVALFLACLCLLRRRRGNTTIRPPLVLLLSLLLFLSLPLSHLACPLSRAKTTAPGTPNTRPSLPPSLPSPPPALHVSHTRRIEEREKEFRNQTSLATLPPSFPPSLPFYRQLSTCSPSRTGSRPRTAGSQRRTCPNWPRC